MTEMSKAELEFRADHRSKSIESKADQFHLAAVLAQLRPDQRAYVAAIDAALLIRFGGQIHGIAVKDCNYGLTARDETRRKNLCDKVETIAAWYGLRADLQRGSARLCGALAWRQPAEQRMGRRVWRGLAALSVSETTNNGD